MIKTTQSMPVSFVATETNPHAAVLVGTEAGLWFFGSRQWIELEGHQITAIAPDATGIWAIVNQTELWHRSSAGWQSIKIEYPLRLNCLLPIDANTVLVGTADAHLLRVTDHTVELLHSFELAPGREDWYTPWGGLPAVRSMAMGQSGEIYVNVHVGGILRSDDQGRSWSPTIDVHADVHQVQTVPHHPNWVVAATAQGLAMSSDRGASWQFDREQLHGAYARAIAIQDDVIFMSASTGPHTSKAALYRRPLAQSAAFIKCEQGLPAWFSDNIDTACLIAFQDRVVFGTDAGQLFMSTDTGQTWHEMISDLPTIHTVSFAAAVGN